MESIRVQRLRCLSDTGDIQIKPITVLLGENSSGKSTFLRLFPLLKQSVETRTTGPLLWNGRLVDFGNYENAHQNNAEEGITFSFNFTIEQDIGNALTPWGLDIIPVNNILDKISVSLTLKLAEDSNTQSTTIQSIILNLNDSKVQMDFEKDGYLSKFEINDLNILRLTGKHLFRKTDSQNLLPFLVEIKETLNEDRESEMFRVYSRWRRTIVFFSIFKLLAQKIKNIFPRDTSLESAEESAENIAKIIFSVGLGSSDAMLKDIKQNRFIDSENLKKISSWDINNSDFQEIKNLLVAKFLPIILEKCDKLLGDCFRKVSYMEPFRKATSRYERTQDFPVDEVDSIGQNLPMFIRSLTEEESQNFRDWTRQYFGFEVILSQILDLVSLKIKSSFNKGKDSETEGWINIVDTGFGFSQILPVITQLWLLNKNRKIKRDILSNTLHLYQIPTISLFGNFFNTPSPIIFAVEQPELHLHPRLQGMLTDAFVASIQAAKDNEIDLRLVIETHSETLINKLGDLVAKKKIEADDINIVLFETEHESGNVTVKTSHFDEDGYLIDWPLGFFEMDMDV